MPHIFGSEQLAADVISRDLCIGCGACTHLCPYFRNYKGKTARLFPCDLEKGRCFAHCPKVEVDLDELTRQRTGKPYDGAALGHYSSIHAARAGKNLPAGQFQSGGTISALMFYALKTGRIDGAVLTDREGLVPLPRLVTSPEAVLECASSKFTAAPTLSAFNKAAADGYSQLGVVGTPCQTTALAQIRSNPLEREEFTDPVAFSLGLFCTWALDTRKLMAFLPQCVDTECILSMDVPPPPREVFEVNTGSSKVEIPLKQIRPLIPPTCFICTDMTAELSDVSVGNLEGKPGWNTLIIRSEQGREIVEEAVKAGFLETEPLPEETLPALCKAATAKKQRSLYNAHRKGLVNTTEEDKRAAIRLPENVLNAIINREKEDACHD